MTNESETYSPTVDGRVYMANVACQGGQRPWSITLTAQDYDGTSDTQTVTGSSGCQVIPPPPPSPPPPPLGAVSHISATGTSFGSIASATNAGTTVTTSGEGAFTVSQYASDPLGKPSFLAAGEYFDVDVAPASTFLSLQVEDCNLGGGAMLEWWNGSQWMLVSPQSFSAGPPGCATANLTPGSSSPTIVQLTGTVFAVAIPPVTLNSAKTNGTRATVKLGCSGPVGYACNAKLSLTVVETLKRGKVIAVAAARRGTKAPKTSKKTVVIGTTTVTVTTGHTKTITISLNRAGKRLLASRHKLSAKLSLAESTNTITSRTVTFKQPKPKKNHKR